MGYRKDFTNQPIMGTNLCSTGWSVGTDTKYELIAQTKKHHWSLRQVANYEKLRKETLMFGWPRQKICLNLENLWKYIKHSNISHLFLLALMFRFWHTKSSYLLNIEHWCAYCKVHITWCMSKLTNCLIFSMNLSILTWWC